ncbi:MAG: LysM peptidoglycan-binding domain-containing protein [Verrucomicrobia bacterium]|nr:LysM peptidoglycan-binding domain-containing protein [Verrucomicrobiota bacterium]
MRFRFYIVLCTPLLLTGCIPTLTAMKTSEPPSESIVEELRSEIAELRHEIQSKDIELKIIEDKLEGGGEKFSSHLEEQILTLSRKLAALEKVSEKIASDIRTLSEHANQTSSSLGLYRERIEEIDAKVHEKRPAFQLKSYRVKAGDSLEKIAKRHKIPVETLKKANNLTDDRIMIGQDLQIPDHG